MNTEQDKRKHFYIPHALAKVVNGLMSRWKDLQEIDKIDAKFRVAPEKVSEVEMGFPAFIICKGQTFPKLMYEKSS